MPSWIYPDKWAFLIEVLIAYLVLKKVIARGVKIYSKRLPRIIEPEKNFNPLIIQLLDAFLLIGAIGLIVHYFGVQPSRLFQTLAIFALSVSLSLKASVENYISGYIILFSRPFRPHDKIMLIDARFKDNQIVGEVLRIGKRSTTILLESKHLLFVPNADLLNNPIVNMTYPASSIVTLC